MKTKRPKPRQLPSGSWNVQVMVNGKSYSITDEDPDVAQAKAMALQAGVLEKVEKNEAMTLSEAIDAYIEAKEDKLSVSTVKGYYAIKRSRFPRLMKQNAWSITKEDVQRAVDAEIKSGLDVKTVEKGYGLVRPALKALGVDVSGVEFPRKNNKQKSYMQIDEIDSFFEEVKKDDLELEILVAIWLGMRRSEIFGLCWDCVDTKTGWVWIKRAWVPDKTGKFVLQDRPKNKHSERPIKCPPYILDKLEERRDGRTEGRIFTGHPDTLLKRIHRICRRVGITDTSIHGLRHTFAAIMQRLNVPDNVAMRRGGWSEEKTYKGVYSYVFDEVELSESRRIDEFYMAKLNGTTLKFELHCRKTKNKEITTVECDEFPGVVGKGKTEEDAIEIFCAELMYSVKAFCWNYDPRSKDPETEKIFPLVLKIVALDAEEIPGIITWENEPQV